MEVVYYSPTVLYNIYLKDIVKKKEEEERVLVDSSDWRLFPISSKRIHISGEQPMLIQGKTITYVSQGFPVTFGMHLRKRSRKKAGYIGKKFEPPKI